MGTKREPGIHARRDIRIFIIDFIINKGYSPTHREIGAGCGIRSTNTVAYHLDIMEEQGVITREHYLPRTIKVIK